MTTAKPDCERQDGSHHSDDRVSVYYGKPDPMILCGKHAQDVANSIRVVKAARARVDMPSSGRA